MGISTLMYTSDGSSRYFLSRKMENTRPMREEMDGKVFISRQTWHFSFADNMIKVFIPTSYLDLACK